MAIYMDRKVKRRGCGVTREHVLEGGDVGVLECSQQLIAECGVDISTLIVSTTLLHVLSDERWPFYYPPQGLLIDAAFAVSRRNVSWIDA